MPEEHSHRDVDVQGLAVGFARRRRRMLVDLKAVDGHRAGGELDLFTGAHPGVGAFAVDLDGADAAGHLLDLPGQGGNAGVDAVFGDPGGAAGRQ